MLTPRRLLPVACLAATMACSHGPKASGINPPPPPAAAHTAVGAAMDRQVRMAREIRNATDAGEGDFEARQLREQLVANPGNLETRLQLGARYEVLGLPELGIEHYRLATERFPAESAPQIRLAQALHAKGRTGDAAAGLENYLAGYAEAPGEAHSWAGILRDTLGDYHAAESHHRDALERSVSGAAYLHNNLGQNLVLQSRPGEAMAEFRAALELEPANAVARNNLAMALAADPAEAAAVLEAGTNDPATAHSNLAAILIEQDRYAEARHELNLALGYKPDHMAALANLTLLSELDGKPAQVARPFTEGNSSVSGLRRFGRAIAGVFVSSETLPAGQPVAGTRRTKGSNNRPGE